MYRNYLKVSNDGYTLMNSLLQLTIFLLSSQLFLLSILYIYRTEDWLTDVTETDWALFLQQTDSYLSNVDSLTLQKSPPGIRYKIKNEEFDIELYSNMIRKQKNRLGHEPMLMNVSTLDIIGNGQSITFQVKFSNGMEKEHTFYVTYST